MHVCLFICILLIIFLFHCYIAVHCPLLPLFAARAYARPYLGGTALYRESSSDEYGDSAPHTDTEDSQLSCYYHHYACNPFHIKATKRISVARLDSIAGSLFTNICE